MKKADEAVGFRIRERTQQNAVDHAENGAVGADPERERHDRNDREPGALQEPAKCVLKILADDFHERG